MKESTDYLYYQDDYITLYHGDCLEILPKLNVKVDLVLTDPPYGIGMSRGGQGAQGKSISNGKVRVIPRRTYTDTWDESRPSAETLKMVLKCCRVAMIFGGNYLADLLPTSTHWLVWDKLNTMPSFSDCELIWTNIPRKSTKKITVEYNGLLGAEESRKHPTQKPVKLIATILNSYSESGYSILDPFLGSGTTAVAAKNLKRKCIGIEIEEKYLKIAVNRLRQEILI